MRNLIVVVLVGAVLAGCAGQQTLSNYARTGDTVAIAVAPSEPDLFIRKEDASVTLHDAAANTYAVTLRNLFKVYADPSSSYAVRSLRKSGWASPEPYEVLADPYQGYWIGIVDLVDPTTGVSPSVQTGVAQLVFSSAVTGDKILDIELLSGQGSPNPLEEAFTGLAPVEALESMPQVRVVVGGSPATPIGAGSFTFQYVTGDFGGEETAPRVITGSPDQRIQLMTSRSDNGDGITTLRVMLINPKGFKADNTIIGNELFDGMSLFRDLRFSIVWDKKILSVTDTNWQSSLYLMDSQYVDLDGNVVTGLVTNMSKIR